MLQKYTKEYMQSLEKSAVRYHFSRNYFLLPLHTSDISFGFNHFNSLYLWFVIFSPTVSACLLSFLRFLEVAALCTFLTVDFISIRVISSSQEFFNLSFVPLSSPSAFLYFLPVLIYFSLHIYVYVPLEITTCNLSFVIFTVLFSVTI